MEKRKPLRPTLYNFSEDTLEHIKELLELAINKSKQSKNPRINELELILEKLIKRIEQIKTEEKITKQIKHFLHILAYTAEIIGSLETLNQFELEEDKQDREIRMYLTFTLMKSIEMTIWEELHRVLNL